MDGAHLFFSGFSEVGRYVSWIRKQLDCVPDCGYERLDCRSRDGNADACGYMNMTIDTVTPKCHTPGAQRMFQRAAKGMLGLSSGSLKNSSLTAAMAWIELRDGLCRESRYGVLGGINASCASGRVAFNMTYRWKTFQHDDFDAADRARVLAAAKRGGPVFLVLEGGGPHHFAKFPEHHRVRAPHTLFTTVADDWNWPQRWIDDYVNSTKALLRLHVGTDRLPPNVCVLWKAMHVGPRLNTGQLVSSHHPSVVNGPHHWLNRLAISAAQDLGIGVVDLSEYTMAAPPIPKLNGAHFSKSAEGDPYHGFPLDKLTPVMLKQMCSQCAQAMRAAAAAGIRRADTARPRVKAQCAKVRTEKVGKKPTGKK